MEYWSRDWFLRLSHRNQGCLTVQKYENLDHELSKTSKLIKVEGLTMENEHFEVIYKNWNEIVFGFH